MEELHLKRIASAEVQRYLRAHEEVHVHEFLLQHKEVLGVPASLLADQLIGRQKAKHKLPLIYKTEGIVLPPPLHIEQASSEEAAQFKASLVQSILGKKKNLTGADLTGGLGVDSFYLSKHFNSFAYVETNHSLASIAKHNLELLGSGSMPIHVDGALPFLESLPNKLDFIFVDPSRRGSTSNRVFKLTETEPHVIELMPLLLQKASYVLIKTSPLLDIRLTLNQLSHVHSVYVLALHNECKEVLFLVQEKKSQGEVVIHAVNRLPGHDEVYSFTYDEEHRAKPVYSDPLTYLYEPNASVLKAGAFKHIAVNHNIYKIHPNTHFYTSDHLIENFPGRIFKVFEWIKPQPKIIARLFPNGKVNLIVRNFPQSATMLKKKFHLHDGGARYLLVFAGQRQKFFIVAERIK